jgi:hypothetical protein
MRYLIGYGANPHRPTLVSVPSPIWLSNVKYAVELRASWQARVLTAMGTVFFDGETDYVFVHTSLTLVMADAAPAGKKNSAG